MFNLKATNGQVIGTSQLYESEASRAENRGQTPVLAFLARLRPAHPA
jgi:hypothetical protein